jgi:cytochrome c oxidase subunit 1
MAKWQPYIFGIGIALMGLFQMGAGTLGVSRRHWDMAFTGAEFTFKYQEAAWLMLGLAGITGVMSAVGGIMFVVIAVGSLLIGKKVDLNAPAPAAPAPAPTAAAVAHHGSAGTFEVPGTFALAMVFLISFVLYYFVNWKYLASTWGMS